MSTDWLLKFYKYSINHTSVDYPNKLKYSDIISVDVMIMVVLSYLLCNYYYTQLVIISYGG